MGKPCRVSFIAFMDGDIEKGDAYDDMDLENGIDYCIWLIEEGYTHEPLDNFNLKDFIAWAQLKQLEPSIT